MIQPMREQTEKELITARNLINKATDEIYNEDAFVPLRMLRASITAITQSMNTLENAFDVERKGKG